MRSRPRRLIRTLNGGEVALAEVADSHLTSWRELRAHLRDERKVPAYVRLLTDFGIDADRLDVSGRRPRLILAEQAGAWFEPEDRLRVGLLAALSRREIFDDAGSGAVQLAHDALSHRGIKRHFLRHHLHARLPPVNYLGSPFLRRHQGRSYASLRLAGAARERVAEIFEISERMLTAAMDSPPAFAREVAAIFDAGVRDGLRPMLPANRDRRSLEEIAVRLAELDLLAACRPFREVRRMLSVDVAWPALWRRVNEVSLGVTIGDLEPIVDRFLLAVSDPRRMARSLIAASCHPPGEPIVVAGIVTDEDVYRMVVYDPADDRFYLRFASRPRSAISWEEVRAHASAGRSGGVARVVKYLMMAASGFYMVADPRDGFTGFERRADEIHRRRVGRRFPWVSFPVPFAGPGAYLSSFGPDFAAHRRAATREFFAPEIRQNDL